MKTERRAAKNTNSSPVFSYYARSNKTNSTLPGQRNKTKPSTNWARLRYVPSYFALLAIGFATLYACYLQPNPRIVLKNVPNTINKDPSQYQGHIQTIWSQSVFNRTKLTVNTDELRRSILSQFPELAEANIELPLLGKRPTIHLVAGRPAIRLVSKNGAFYVNASGKVMERTDAVINNNLAELPTLNDLTDLPAEPGKAIVSSVQASYLISLSRQLAAEKVAVESITLPKDAVNQADVRIAGQKYYIKFSIDLDPRQAVGTYLAVKSSLDKAREPPAEYIDVRVEEKAFYK